MIDTVRFKAPISRTELIELKKHSVESRKTDRRENRILFRYFNSQVKINSYSKEINIFFDEFHPDSIFFELSLPKFYYGTNLFLLEPHQFQEACFALYNILITKFRAFPHYNRWIIQRLDLCYAWKLDNEIQAEELLRILKCYKFPRLKNHPYDDSIYSTSENTTVKIYLKHREYKKHDFRHLIKNGFDFFAYEVYNQSKGVIRFEVEMRKNTLTRKFNNPNLKIRDINTNNITSLLASYFNKLMKNKSTELEDSLTVYHKLEKLYPNRSRALQLFQFYKMYHSTDPQDREIISKYNRSTIYRNIISIKKANVGILADISSISKDFEFTIPSSYAIKPQQRREPLRVDTLPDVRSTNSRTYVASTHQIDLFKKGGEN